MNKLIEQLENAGRSIPDAPHFASSVMRRVRVIETDPAVPRLGWRWRIGGLAGALAACLLLVIALQNVGSNGVAFAEVIEKIRQTRTVTMAIVDEREDGTMEWSTVSAAVSEGYRLESAREAWIWSARSGRLVKLEKGSVPRAFVWPGDHRDWPNDLYTWLKELKGDEATRIGEVMLGESKTVIYRSVTAGGALPPGLRAETRFWVDTDTHLLVQVELRPIDPPENARVPTRILIHHIQFDVPLDEGIFDTEPPDEFEVYHPEEILESMRQSGGN